MDCYGIIESIYEFIDGGKKYILNPGSVILNREALEQLVSDLKLKLPDEIKQARKIKEDRLSILSEAQKDADNMLKDAENKIIQMVDEHVITKQAIIQKEEIVDNANKISKEISMGTREYADAVLGKVEDVLKEMMHVVDQNRKELK